MVKQNCKAVAAKQWGLMLGLPVLLAAGLAAGPVAAQSTPPPAVFANLYAFSGGADGYHTDGALVVGADGDFYGTAIIGGTYGEGTVFKVSSTGTFTLLHTFDPYDAPTSGAWPLGALVLGSDGNFYGSTEYGGTTGYGTLFKMTPGGALTTLYTFSGSDGQSPAAALVQGSDGSFYGTTSSGGASYTGGVSGSGSIFRITADGTLTTLYSFSGVDGQTPTTPLIQGSDGNFYGTTSRGGTNGLGTVFKITPGGTFTSLVSFDGTNGSGPNAGALVQFSSGMFYGTTRNGGTSSCGNVFSMTPDGTLSTLASFDCVSAEEPTGLLLGRDGNFYGLTTSAQGTSKRGTAYRITPSGTLTMLASFDNTLEQYPLSTLVEGRDGRFYGTTSFGGNRERKGYGNVFVLSPTGK